MPKDNTTGSFPKSDTVRARIVEEVRHGLFVGQDVLPGERDLAVALGVSRTTLRRALADLVRSGFLGQRQGYGTFVRRRDPEPTEPDPKQPLFSPCGPGDELLESGMASRAIDQTIGMFTPAAGEAMALDLTSGAKIWRARRTLIDAEGRPFAVERIVVAAASIGSIPLLPSELLASLDQRGLKIDRSRRRLRVTFLSEGDTRILTEGENTTGIISEQHGFSADGRPRIVWLMVQRLDSFDIAFDVTRIR